ncbi:MAG: DUF4388 domain-containing protein [Deltaproteobacteria bacterium]
MRRILLIDTQGRVSPRADETRRELADRAGTFELLPSAPDLLVAIRSPALGGPTPAPGATLVGDLAAFPLADFLGFIHQVRMTGTLAVGAPGGLRSVSFRDGRVSGSSSDVRGERPAEVSARLGYPDEASLPPSERWRVAREQVTAIFHAVLTVREGVFHLVQGEDEPAGHALSLDTQALLMDAIRRIDEMELFRSRIPGGELFLRRRDPVEPVELEPEEARLLALVDGRRRVLDVARDAHLSEFDATRVLYRLVEAGFVETTTESLSPSLSLDRSRGVLTGMNEVFREVVRAVGSHGDAGPLLSGAADFLADPSSRFSRLWLGLEPAEDGSLDADRVLAALAALDRAEAARLDPRGDRCRILLAALRELMFFYLFQAGERLSREDDEAVSHSVKRRLEEVESMVAAP